MARKPSQRPADDPAGGTAPSGRSRRETIVEAFLALRTTLCSSRAELALFTEAFNTVFAGEAVENPLAALGEIEKAVLPRAGVPQTGPLALEPDPDAEPIVDFNLLSDSRDVERLMDGFRRLGTMQQSAAMREVTTDPFPASYSDRVRRIGVVNTKNRIATRVIAKLLDGPAALRSWRATA